MATILKLDIGDIVNIDLNPVRGEEKNKIRPCIILQNQITPLRLVTVLPITEDKEIKRQAKNPGLSVKRKELKTPRNTDHKIFFKSIHA